MYGAVDRKGKKADGKVCSYSPGWGQKKEITDLDEEIGILERDLEADVIHSEERGTVRRDIKRLKIRKDDIVESKPKYSDSEERLLFNELKRLNEQVSKTLYSEYEQEQPGKYSNPRREADINDFAHIAKIEVNKELAEACNIDEEKMNDVGSTSNNVHISRNNADKVRRLICDYFDIPEYNREYLRKKNFEGRKSTVSMSGVTPERYNMAFGKEGNGNDEVTKLKEEVTNLRKLLDGKKKSTEDIDIELQNMADEGSVKMWICDYPGCCGEKMRLSQKASHTRKYNKLVKSGQLTVGVEG